MEVEQEWAEEPLVVAHMWVYTDYWEAEGRYRSDPGILGGRILEEVQEEEHSIVVTVGVLQGVSAME